MPATNKITALMARQTTDVPKSGCLRISPEHTMIGKAAGRSVCRRSSIDWVRFSRKYARNRISAGFASSDGWNDSNPKRIQRCVLCERSRENTATSMMSVTPKSENTTAGCL
jgi:hypothetical protein